MQTGFGPARRTLAQWQSAMARAARSDLGIAERCRREGVSTASFCAWRKRLGGALAPMPPAAAPTGGAAFVDLGALELGHGGDRGGTLGSGWEIELDLGAGAALRLRRRAAAPSIASAPHGRPAGPATPVSDPASP